MGETSSTQSSGPPADDHPAPVLDYARPTLRQRRPVSPRVLAITAGFLVAFLSASFSGGKSSIIGAIMLGIFTAVGWLLAARAGNRWHVPIVSQIQIWIAGAVFIVGIMFILQRAENAEGALGWRYWITYNQGYRRNPLWALRPWPIPAAAFAWGLLVILVHWLRRRACRNTMPACPETASAE